MSAFHIVQKIIECEGWQDRGEFEELYLSNEEYDASESSLTLQWQTCNEQGQERWRAYWDCNINPVRVLHLQLATNKAIYFNQIVDYFLNLHSSQFNLHLQG